MQYIFTLAISILSISNLWGIFPSPYESRKLTATPYHTVTAISPSKKGVIMTTDDGLSWLIATVKDRSIITEQFRVGDPITTYNSTSLWETKAKAQWHYNPRVNLYIYSTSPRETKAGSCTTRISSINSESLEISVTNGKGSQFQFVLHTPRTTDKQRSAISETLSQWQEGDAIALISEKSLSFGESDSQHWDLKNCRNNSHLEAVRTH